MQNERRREQWDQCAVCGDTAQIPLGDGELLCVECAVAVYRDCETRVARALDVCCDGCSVAAATGLRGSLFLCDACRQAAALWWAGGAEQAIRLGFQRLARQGPTRRLAVWAAVRDAWRQEDST